MRESVRNRVGIGTEQSAHEGGREKKNMKRTHAVLADLEATPFPMVKEPRVPAVFPVFHKPRVGLPYLFFFPSQPNAHRRFFLSFFVLSSGISAALFFRETE